MRTSFLSNFCPIEKCFLAGIVAKELRVLAWVKMPNANRKPVANSIEGAAAIENKATLLSWGKFRIFKKDMSWSGFFLKNVSQGHLFYEIYVYCSVRILTIVLGTICSVELFFLSLGIFCTAFFSGFTFNNVFVLVYFLGPFRSFLFFCDWSGWSALRLWYVTTFRAIAYTDQISSCKLAGGGPSPLLIISSPLHWVIAGLGIKFFTDT